LPITESPLKRKYYQRLGFYLFGANIGLVHRKRDKLVEKWIVPLTEWSGLKNCSLRIYSLHSIKLVAKIDLSILILMSRYIHISNKFYGTDRVQV
jgi:hypothetical protein